MDGVKQLLIEYYRKAYFGGEASPPTVGVYWPKVLTWSCLRQQFNFFALYQGQKELPNEVILRLGDGTDFHRLVQKIAGRHFWNKVEIPCQTVVEIAGGEKILIRGRADCIKGDTLYELKQTMHLPYKPRFDHVLQANFYLGSLRMMRGMISYRGYDQSGAMDVREFPIIFSDWHFTHLINRAETLHVLLKSGQPPRCSCRNRRHESGEV